jgi:hypothetical protein
MFEDFQKLYDQTKDLLKAVFILEISNHTIVG